MTLAQIHILRINTASFTYSYLRTVQTSNYKFLNLT